LINKTDKLFANSIKRYISQDNILKDNNRPLTLDGLAKKLKITKGKCWSNIHKLIKEGIIFEINNETQNGYYVDSELIQSLLTDKEESRMKKYIKYIDSPEWINKRALVIKRDNFKCQQCGNKQNLEVHHLTYEHFKDEPLKDLITLCSGCHKSIHYKKQVNSSG